MNTLGTTLFITHAIVWCSSATKPELKMLSWILIFMIQCYLQDRVSRLWCDASILISELITCET